MRAGWVLVAGLCVAAAPASAQPVDAKQFAQLTRTCQTTASTPASPIARKIADVALAQHTNFRGHRIDNEGRIVLFGRTESESDQESEPRVAPEQVPWAQVLKFWEDLQGGKVTAAPNPALEVWFYPGILGGEPSTQVPRRRVRLETLLRAIDRLDPATLGDDGAAIKSALAQSAIRAAIGDVAWSAAFVSSVMKQAGVDATAFAASASHVRYIFWSIRQSLRDLGRDVPAHLYRACDPDLTRPRVGDMYCYHRHLAGTRDPYEAKPGATLFRSLFADIVEDSSVIMRTHCDIVVGVDNATKKVTVIGGNVCNSVSERVLNLNRKGVLSATQGSRAPAPAASPRANGDEPVCPQSQKWFVLLQARE